jgi:hypothetical protein
MLSMPRPIRQIAACSGEGAGACEGVGAGDNGYSFLISPEITGPNSSPYSPLNFDICICSTGK